MRMATRTKLEDGALAIVDALGFARLGARNDAKLGTVHAGAANALVKAGTLFREDGVVRRRELQIDGAAPDSGLPIEVTVWPSLIGGIELTMRAPAALVAVDGDGIACVRVLLTTAEARRVLVNGVAGELDRQGRGAA